MKIAGNVLSIVSLLLLASTLLCGFWIRSHTPAGTSPDVSSIAFHMQIAVVSVVFVLVTLGVLVFSK
jgi:hypothetical protein